MSPCRLRGSVANRSRVPPSWFSTTLTACSSSTLSGYCTGVPVVGFVTFRAARRCCPRHGFLPFEAFLPVHSARPEDVRPLKADILVLGRRHRRVSPAVTACLAPSSLLPGPRGFSPCAEPCPAGCCHRCEIVAPLGLSGSPVARAWRAQRFPRSREGVGFPSLRWFGTSGPDERQRSPRGPARLA